MTITILSSDTINKIAAGEVIDRPLSVIKELVENSIDAGAENILVEIDRGGRNFISVTDDGKGIEKSDLEIALERHATSKLNEDKIEDIRFLGFRGEALPSIAAISKLKISSKHTSSNEGWEIEVHGGVNQGIKPSSQMQGTHIRLTDLFYTTPIRLKFLKSESSETNACVELLNKLSLSHEKIGFTLISNGKKIIDTKKQECGILESNQRIEDILGENFIKDSIKFSYEDDKLKIYGYTSIPTYNSGTSVNQYFFVNRRVVKDKILSYAVKLAYSNLIPFNRSPYTVLFLEIDNDFVDVNVHPNKAEVRFRDGGIVKSAVINAIRSAITNTELRSSNKISQDALEFLQKSKIEEKKRDNALSFKVEEKQKIFNDLIDNHEKKLGEKFSISNELTKDNQDCVKDKLYETNFISNIVQEEISKKANNGVEDFSSEKYPLGFAKCQIDKTYIISEGDGYLVFVDQHAAHERLTLEELKKQIKGKEVKSQVLLVPEVIDLGNVLTEQIIEKKQQLKEIGFHIDRNGMTQVIIRQIPVIFNKENIENLIKYIAENILLFDDIEVVYEKLDEIWGNVACYSSIRAGRVLKLEEMNALLRNMEKTPFSEQCNHGRPSFIKLELKDIRKLFERI
ncbi:MAG: DNA mismatch repair protein MutL [Candidatus Midichloriaceae bacterium]|jgi:DNA mismatch repair protein MutL